MSDMSLEIGLASFKPGLPPPNAVASVSLMKDQVMASSAPLAASARRALRTISWRAVRTGRAIPCGRLNGSGVILSSPTMRMTSSTRSAAP